MELNSNNIITAFLSIIIFGFSSCSNDDGLDKNNFSPSALIFKAVIPADSRSSDISKVPQLAITDTIPLFYGKDIAWFNETTGELRFNDNFSGTVLLGNGNVRLLVYSDNDSLYSINFFATSSVMSYVKNSPVILIGLGGNSCYIKNGYPDWNLADFDKDDPLRIEREKNWNVLVQSEGWKLFILQLKKEGRYRK